MLIWRAYMCFEVNLLVQINSNAQDCPNMEVGDGGGDCQPRGGSEAVSAQNRSRRCDEKQKQGNHTRPFSFLLIFPLPF